MAKTTEPPVLQLPADADAPDHLACKLCSNALREPVRARATVTGSNRRVQVLFGPCGHSMCRQCMAQMVSVALIHPTERDQLKVRQHAPARVAADAAEENETVGSEPRDLAFVDRSCARGCRQQSCARTAPSPPPPP